VAIDRADRSVRLADGERVGYAKLLLATGRAPRRLPFPGAVAEQVLYLRDLADADRLRQALRPGACITIVGGGFIGLEVAASAVALRCRPVVIELAPRLLGRLVPPAIAAFLHARHVAAGVEILLEARLQEIAPAGDDFALVLVDGRAIEADVVMIGIKALLRESTR
jgi:3-phenylpropionate/trans-cinnamate dioxygenase ferredoxin reductase subunit